MSHRTVSATIAYLTNVYPAPSHSFIRREILAHEAAGQGVQRYTIRRHVGDLADPLDRDELAKTRCVLQAGGVGLLLAMSCQAIGRPVRFVRAVRKALQLGRKGDRGRILHLIYLAEACLLRRWLAEQGVDHLHGHFGTNPAAVALLCRMLGGPTYSFTVHGPDEFDAAATLCLKEKTAAASFVVAISQYGESQLCRWVAPEDCAKLQVVHCGLDDRFLAEAASPVPDVQRLVFVGRLTTTKGVFVLLEALKLLRDRGVRPEIVLIGDGPERPTLESELAREGLSDLVQLLGWQSSDQVRQEILRSRALLLPSFAEGLPVVLMESLALGRPVVTTWVAGIPELVEQGGNGWLVPPGSAEALAHAMEQVLATPVEKLSEMGRCGREKVLREHNAATEAAKLAKLFEQAVAGEERAGERESVRAG